MAETIPMRADARRNREKLLTAAAERFAAEGESASLDAIAKAAGVGVGTLYRHFPTRDALVEAAYRSEVEHLRDAATELLDEFPPDVALERWMRSFLDYAQTKNGFKQAFQGVVMANADKSKESMRGALDELLAAGAAAGTLRDDMDALDVLRGMSGIWATTGEDDWRERSERLISLIVDGLRHRAA